MSLPPEMMRLLTETLERLGVSVEHVRLEEHLTGGGLCNVRGKRIVYLDRDNSQDVNLRLLTDAVVAVSDDNTYLAPAVREWIEGTRRI